MYHSFKPGQVWLDTEGKRIQAHGGTVCCIDGVYYFYGENKEKRTAKTESGIGECAVILPGICTIGKTWKILFDAVYKQGGVNGYQSVLYAHGTDMNKSYAEIPWISTNSVSQWCLNVIMSLEFAREYLPEYLETFLA